MGASSARCPTCSAVYTADAMHCPIDGTPLVGDDTGTPQNPLRLLPKPGSSVQGYLLLQILGEGSMGRVYLAEHETIGRKVAIKMLHPALLRSKTATEQFINEARTVNRIGHKNIIEITDFVQTGAGSGCFLVMERLEGRTLEQVLRSDAPLSVKRTLHIARQICDGLAAAHAVGVVHRDLKPGNVFLLEHEGDADFAKLIDFGVAKVQRHASQHLAREIGQPGTGVRYIIGTPAYMSPEQTYDEAVDARSDVYSVGVLLYEMLTGKLPFGGDNLAELLDAHRFATPVPPSTRAALREPIPAGLEALILRCLAKRPEDRPPTMRAVFESLSRLAGQDDVAFGQDDVAFGQTLPAQAISQAALPAARGAQRAARARGPASAQGAAFDEPDSDPDSPTGAHSASKMRTSTDARINRAFADSRLIRWFEEEPKWDEVSLWDADSPSIGTRRRWPAVLAAAVGVSVLVVAGLQVRPHLGSLAGTAHEGMRATLEELTSAAGAWVTEWRAPPMVSQLSAGNAGGQALDDERAMGDNRAMGNQGFARGDVEHGAVPGEADDTGGLDTQTSARAGSSDETPNGNDSDGNSGGGASAASSGDPAAAVASPEAVTSEPIAEKLAEKNASDATGRAPEFKQAVASQRSRKTVAKKRGIARYERLGVDAEPAAIAPDRPGEVQPGALEPAAQRGSVAGGDDPGVLPAARGSADPTTTQPPAAVRGLKLPNWAGSRGGTPGASPNPRAIRSPSWAD